MKCTKKDCSKNAEYVVCGQSVCNDHKGEEAEQEAEHEQTAGDKMIGGN